jgi:GNAT superfamily N-acetyltransferase
MLSRRRTTYDRPVRVRVVEWQPRHRANLDQALGPPDVLCAQSRPALGPPTAGPLWRFTFVAECDGEPVGAAVAFAPRWHSQRLWASVQVAPTHRRRGIGTALLQAVREHTRPDGRPLRAKVFAASPASHFAAARGFTVIQSSRTFRLEARRSPSHRDLIVEAPAPPSIAAAAFRDFYLSSHNWDPPGPMTAEDIAETHIADAAFTIVVRTPAGEMLAAGCLYDDDQGLVLSGGPTVPNDPRAGAATAALLDAVPKPVLVEADDSVPALLAALADQGATVVDEVHVVAEA